LKLESLKFKFRYLIFSGRLDCHLVRGVGLSFNNHDGFVPPANATKSFFGDERTEIASVRLFIRQCSEQCSEHKREVDE
jgi:hypothetical protein